MKIGIIVAMEKEFTQLKSFLEKQIVNPNIIFFDSDYLNNEMAKKFFSELDIKEPDKYDYIIHRAPNSVKPL